MRFESKYDVMDYVVENIEPEMLASYLFANYEDYSSRLNFNINELHLNEIMDSRFDEYYEEEEDTEVFFPEEECQLTEEDLQDIISNMEWALECADFTDRQIDLIKLGDFDNMDFELTRDSAVINDDNLFEDTADGIANYLDREFDESMIDEADKEDLLNFIYEAQTDWIQRYAERIDNAKR